MKYVEKVDALLSGITIDAVLVDRSQATRYGISLGSGCRHLLVEESVSFRSEVIVRPGFDSFCGAHSYMNGGGYIRERVYIGRYCSIGRRVTIGAGAHHMNGVSTHPKLHGSKSRAYSSEEQDFLWPGVDPSKGAARNPTVIQHDVWIGDGAVIMPGVTVGTGAVIGANSVVTRNVEPYAIVAGIPAKMIRRRFPDAVVDALVRTEYWEYPLEQLTKAPMRNVLQFLEAFSDLKGSPKQFETYRITDPQ